MRTTGVAAPVAKKGSIRGATITLSPWAGAWLAIGDRAELGQRALELGVHVNAVAKEQRGPFVVHVFDRSRTLRFAGHKLAELIRFGLDRWAAGADDRGVRWSAGADALAHGHIGPRADTLCGLPWTDEQFAHPERSRCAECWRALDGRAAA
jgi:hypothetical protein